MVPSDTLYSTPVYFFLSSFFNACPNPLKLILKLTHALKTQVKVEGHVETFTKSTVLQPCNPDRQGQKCSLKGCFDFPVASWASDNLGMLPSGQCLK
jgi:hypothetical protein